MWCQKVMKQLNGLGLDHTILLQIHKTHMVPRGRSRVVSWLFQNVAFLRPLITYTFVHQMREVSKGKLLNTTWLLSQQTHQRKQTSKVHEPLCQATCSNVDSGTLVAPLAGLPSGLFPCSCAGVTFKPKGVSTMRSHVQFKLSSLSHYPSLFPCFNMI